MKRIIPLLIVLSIAFNSQAQYRPVEHRKVSGKEIAIKTPGSYAEPGANYVLANDITSEKSALFLGKDITLDLNGYTIRFADANYEHIPNSGFEEGLKYWDVSKAPGAKVVNAADVHVFLGEKIMSLEAGDEITSAYINISVANRSYFAICGITGRYWHDMKKYPDDEMKVSVYVEDINGNVVKQIAEYGDGPRQSAPVEARSPRLGGGFVYAHLTDLPVGKYRVRIKADTDCLIDEVDIRPAMDVGVNIIGKTNPLAHYDHLSMQSYPPTIPSFYDYTGDMKTGTPLTSLPQIEGAGTIVIKNGTIESGVEGIQSWGIQSSTPEVKVVLENVEIKNSGISSGAVDLQWAAINNCKFEVDVPFLIQRHVSLCNVIIRGDNPTEIANSAFLGGQGCLSIKGKYSLVHDNLFVNNQTVTNHYSIMGTGEGSKIYNNRFEPKQGSGIYVSRYTEVFNNVFNLETSPPTCEYGREEYSTAAIRLGDYNAVPGSPKASIGSKIHNNKIFITAKDFPSAPEEYMPMAWGVFYSARGGENYVYENEFVVNKVDPDSKVKAAALYICGGPEYFGGQFYDNHISTNVPAAWIATTYGSASNSKLYNNTIVPFGDATFKTFQIGAPGKKSVAENVEFRSNEVKGGNFVVDATNQHHSYSVYWTLDITVNAINSNKIKKADIKIIDSNNKIVLESKTDNKGNFITELPEFKVDGQIKTKFSPYVVMVNGIKKQVELSNNKVLHFTME